jgi:polygalacturonase
MNLNRRGFLAGLAAAAAATAPIFLIADKVKFGFVNVKDFGAIGDGVTDDTAAIRAAADAVAPGGTIYFPSGTYFVGDCWSDNSRANAHWTGARPADVPHRTESHA